MLKLVWFSARLRRMASFALPMLIGATGVGLAQPKGPEPGDWLIVRASEGPETCHITLLAEPTIGGQGVIVGNDCIKFIPWSIDIAAWREGVDGIAILADATRKAVITLIPVDDGDYTGDGPDRIQYVLTPERPPRQKK